MEIYYFAVEYVPEYENDRTNTVSHGGKISAGGWWDAMGVVTRHVLPTLEGEILGIRVYQDK